MCIYISIKNPSKLLTTDFVDSIIRLYTTLYTVHSAHEQRQQQNEKKIEHNFFFCCCCCFGFARLRLVPLHNFNTILKMFCSVPRWHIHTSFSDSFFFSLDLFFWLFIVVAAVGGFGFDV